MQTTIDLLDEDAEVLSRMGQQENLSRKALIEKGVADYVQQHRVPAFGIWKHRRVDGLRLQQAGTVETVISTGATAVSSRNGETCIVL